MSGLIEGDDNEDISVDGNKSSAPQLLRGSRNKRISATGNELGVGKKESWTKGIVIAAVGIVVGAVVLGILYNYFGWTFIKI